MKRNMNEDNRKRMKSRMIDELSDSSQTISSDQSKSNEEGFHNLGPSIFVHKKSHHILHREDIAVDDLQPLTKYTWNLYHVSPLCGFEESEIRLKQYSIFLRNYFSASKIQDDVEFKVEFCVVDAFGKNDEDMAVKVEVSCCKDKFWKLIYGGIFLSWDTSKASLESIKHLPLLLCRGTIPVRHLVHDALGKLFDCVITQHFISQRDLIWINGLFVSVSTVGKGEKAIKLTFRPPWKDDLRIEYKLIMEDARKLWNRFHAEDSDLLGIEEVKSFYDTIVQHISEQYKINLKDFKIDRIVYPDVGIGFDGKLKCRDIDIWNELLHILCSELLSIDVSKVECSEIQSFQALNE